MCLLSSGVEWGGNGTELLVIGMKWWMSEARVLEASSRGIYTKE